MGSTFVASRVWPESLDSGMASRWACSSRKEPVPAEQLELKKNFTREASFFENPVIKLARAAPISMMHLAWGAIASAPSTTAGTISSRKTPWSVALPSTCARLSECPAHCSAAALLICSAKGWARLPVIPIRTLGNFEAVSDKSAFRQAAGAPECF